MPERAKSTPYSEKRKVRQCNADIRPREYLTDSEVEALIKAASQVGRHRHRDKTLILLAYTHGLRVEEAVSMRWDQVNLDDGLIDIRRVKGGIDSTHHLRGREIRWLRKLSRDYKGQHVFQTERGGPMTTRAVQLMVARAGARAGIPWPVHPHMLRHACGHKLANDGQDTRSIQVYLGHRQIRHTERYTEVSAARFKSFWQD